MDDHTTGEDNESRGRILSIQSHVVRGCVGNRAAVFPLQLLRHHVDYINTVQYTSMHVHEGEELQPSGFSKLLSDFSSAESEKPERKYESFNGIRGEHMSTAFQYNYILTGFINSPQLLYEVIGFIKRQKNTRSESRSEKELWWVCDPVFGDDGVMYVSPSLISILRAEAFQLIDVLTPNQYELEWLCNHKVDTLKDAADCCTEMHKKGIKMIVVTSISLPESDKLVLLGSERTGDEKGRFFSIEFPKLNLPIRGTGDLMTAMILSGLERYNCNLSKACENATAVVQDVIRRTMSRKGNVDCIDVVLSADGILNPLVKFVSKPLVF